MSRVRRESNAALMIQLQLFSYSVIKISPYTELTLASRLPRETPHSCDTFSFLVCL